jgi:hypothetical protein
VCATHGVHTGSDCLRCETVTTSTITVEDRAAWLDVKAEVLDTAAGVDPDLAVQGPARAAEARVTAGLYRAGDASGTSPADQVETLTGFAPAPAETVTDPLMPWWTPELDAALARYQHPADYAGYHRDLDAYQAYEDDAELADHDAREHLDTDDDVDIA